MVSAPNPDSFVYIPEEIAEAIGESTHQGARLELAVLSSMLYYWQINRDQEQTYTASGGVKIATERDEFVLSANRVATNLWFRWFVKLPDDPEYSTFFERVRASIKRLKQNGYLIFRRTAAGKENYRYGSVWTFKGTPLDAFDRLPQCRASGFVFSTPSASSYTHAGLVNAVDLVGSRIIGENYTSYRYGEVCSNLYDRGMFHDYRKWTQLVAANGARGSRHTTCGAYRKSEILNIDNASTYMIYANFDLDNENFLDNYDQACGIARHFISEGVRAEDIICSWTGGKGCHVQIPGGAFGNPVFRRPYNQKNTLKFFAKLKMDVVRVDPNLFDPQHLIRMIGSQHEKTGLFKQAYTADDFMRRHPFEILNDTMFMPFEIPDPSYAPLCPSLVEGLVECAEADHKFDMVEFHDVENMDAENFGTNSTIRAALEQGVAEGQSWGNYVGRDMRMYVLAGHFFRKYGGNEDRALEDLMKENERNSPPLPDYVIKRKINSAARAAGETRKSRKTYTT